MFGPRIKLLGLKISRQWYSGYNAKSCKSQEIKGYQGKLNKTMNKLESLTQKLKMNKSVVGVAVEKQRR